MGLPGKLYLLILLNRMPSAVSTTGQMHQPSTQSLLDWVWGEHCILQCRVDAHGYNHNLQVYKQAAENPSQGNITRIPMNSRELHGLVSKQDRQKLLG